MKTIILKPHHHVKLDMEFSLDCEMWELFLTDISVVVRPFIDLQEEVTAEVLNFYSDASANPEYGYGAIFDKTWLFGKWEKNFIVDNDPSIEFLELFALCAAILTWEDRLVAMRIIVFCGNISVVHMMNNLSLSCAQCMKLIRILTLNNLKFDRRVFV